MKAARITERLATELFDFARPSTRGEMLFGRIFEALMVLWTLQHCWEWAPYIQRIEAVVLPLGVANYLDVSVFFDDGLSYALAAGVTVAVIAGFFRWTKLAYPVGLVGFHLLYVSRYSLGEISHGSNFVGLALLAFTIATIAFDKDERTVLRFAFGFLFFVYGIGYTSAGVCKLIGTGLDWPRSAHFALWVGERTIDVTSREGVFEPTFLQRLGLAYPWLGSASLAFGLMAELAGVLMWVRRYRMPVVLALLGMHIGVDLTLDILFLHNIMILALLALPWGKLLDMMLERTSPRPAPV
ncbi:MAG: hypothetical protein KUG77_07100 [Nannocystaceae bacterium]|nr:hypothetical protein [Nannocystaceae bacterium]